MPSILSSAGEVLIPHSFLFKYSLYLKRWILLKNKCEQFKREGLLLPVEDEVEFDYKLRGKAWKVYWLLLKSGRPMSVREVEKALRFSSPSVAHHHLEQLRQMGLVQKQKVGGNYSLVSEVKIGVLRHFVKLGRLMFPRYFFYAIFSSAFYIAYITILMQDLTRENLFILSFGAIVTLIFWYEAIRFWRLKPF